MSKVTLFWEGREFGRRLRTMPGCATCPLSQGIAVALFSLLAQTALRGTALYWLDFGLTKCVCSSVILRLYSMSKQCLHSEI